MNLKNFIIFTLTFLIIGCDGSYQSNDEDMIYEIDPFVKSGGFIAVGNSGTILTSSDGITWTSRTSAPHHHLFGVSHGGSTFVTVGNGGTILTSSDGTSWTSRTSGTDQELQGITYGVSTFVAVGGNKIITSSDGTSWTLNFINARDLYTILFRANFERD